MCDTGGEMKVAIWESFNTSTVSGMLKIIKLVVSGCCHPDTQIITTRLARNQQDLEENFDLDSEDFICPVTWTVHSGSLPETNSFYSFMGALESPGMALLIPDDPASTIEFLSILLSLWELLVVIVLCCIMAGMLIWALDTSTNSKEFPRPFVSGVSAGTWWAFVSMTTVGYGDKTPKSVYGRILGCVWILAGTILIAIFTAALTTAFSQDGVVDAGIFGKKVGVLNGSEDLLSVMAMGGQVNAFSDFESMIEALDTRQVSRIAVDIMHVIPYTKMMEAKKIRFHQQISRPAMHGFMVNRRRTRADHVECFQYELGRQRFYYHSKFDAHNSLSKIADTLKGSETINKMLKIHPLWLGVSAIVVLLVVVVIAAVDRYQLKKKWIPSLETGKELVNGSHMTPV